MPFTTERSITFVSDYDYFHRRLSKHPHSNHMTKTSAGKLRAMCEARAETKSAVESSLMYLDSRARFWKQQTPARVVQSVDSMNRTHEQFNAGYVAAIGQMPFGFDEKLEREMKECHKGTMLSSRCCVRHLQLKPLPF